MNTKAAPSGRPVAPIVYALSVECSANCTVLFNASTVCPDTLAHVGFIVFSIPTYFASFHHLYDRYEGPKTINLITDVVNFSSLLVMYPAAAPDRNLSPADRTTFFVDKLLGMYPLC